MCEIKIGNNKSNGVTLCNLRKNKNDIFPILLYFSFFIHYHFLMDFLKKFRKLSIRRSSSLSERSNKSIFDRRNSSSKGSTLLQSLHNSKDSLLSDDNDSDGERQKLTYRQKSMQKKQKSKPTYNGDLITTKAFPTHENIINKNQSLHNIDQKKDSGVYSEKNAASKKELFGKLPATRGINEKVS